MEDRDILVLVSRALANALYISDTANAGDFNNVQRHANRCIFRRNTLGDLFFWVDLSCPNDSEESIEKVETKIRLAGQEPNQYFIINQQNQAEYESIVFLNKLFNTFRTIEEKVFGLEYKDTVGETTITRQYNETEIIKIIDNHNKEFARLTKKITDKHKKKEIKIKLAKEAKEKLFRYIHRKLDLFKKIQRMVAGFTDFLVIANNLTTEEKTGKLIEIFGEHARSRAIEFYCRSNSEINLVSAQPLIDVLYQYSHFLDEKINMLEFHLEIYDQINEISINDIYEPPFSPLNSEEAQDIANNAEELERDITAAQHNLDYFYETILPVIQTNYFFSQNEFYSSMSNIAPTSMSFALFCIYTQSLQRATPSINQIDSENVLLADRPLMLRDQLHNNTTRYLDLYRQIDILGVIGGNNSEVYEKYQTFLTFGFLESFLQFNEIYQDTQKIFAKDFLEKHLETNKNNSNKTKTQGAIPVADEVMQFQVNLSIIHERTPYFDENRIDIISGLNSRLFGIMDRKQLLDLPRITFEKENSEENDTEKSPASGGGEGTQNSSNLTVQDFPGKLKSDIQETKTFQTYEEYLEHVMQETHRKMIEEANKKIEKSRSQIGIAQLPYVSGDHRYGNDYSQNTIYAANKTSMDYLTLEVFSPQALAFYNFLASSQPNAQAQIVSFSEHQVRQNSYRMAAGGYEGGSSSTNTYSPSNNKAGNLYNLSNYQSGKNSNWQKFSSFMTSTNITAGERVAYGVAGAYHMVKICYFAERYVRSLILNAAGKESPLTNRQAMEGLATIGFWVGFWTVVSKISLRFAGAAGVVFMAKDLIQFGKGQLTALLLEHYGLTEKSIPGKLNPKLQTLIQLQQAMQAFQKDPSERNRLNFVLATNLFMEPVLTQTQTFMQLSENQFIELTPRRYRHDQEHYRNGNIVLSVPQIFASRFNQNQQKLQDKKNIQFASMRIIGKSGETIFSKTYLGPEGELHNSFGDQAQAWSSFDNTHLDDIDLEKTSLKKTSLYPNTISASIDLDKVNSSSVSYHLVLNRTNNTVKVMDNSLTYQAGKLIEANGDLMFVTNGDASTFSSVSLKRFVELGKQNTPKIHPIIVQSTPALLNRAFQTHKKFGPVLLPVIQSFTHTLFQKGKVDEKFYHMVKNTKPSEGFKIVTLINPLVEQGKQLLQSQLFKHSNDKALIDKTTKQFVQLFWADCFYNNLNMKKTAKIKNTSQKPVIQNPYDIVFGS